MKRRKRPTGALLIMEGGRQQKGGGKLRREEWNTVWHLSGSKVNLESTRTMVCLSERRDASEALGEGHRGSGLLLQWTEARQGNVQKEPESRDAGVGKKRRK